MTSNSLKTTLDTANKLCQTKEPLVANGWSTRVYARDSFWGHVWSAIHYFCGTGNDCLAKVILKTADSLRTISHERQDFCEAAEADGVLGNFWKSYSIAEMKTSAAKQMTVNSSFQPNAEQLEKLVAAIDWASRQLNQSSVPFEQDFSIFQKAKVLPAIAKVEAAQSLEIRWNKLNGSDIATLGTLFRELITVYANNDEEVTEKRDLLQKKLGFCLGGEGHGWKKEKCPQELLFGPLVKIAYRIGKQTHELDAYQQFFASLMANVPEEKQQAMQQTASKIIRLARFFRESEKSEKLENIPDLVTACLQDEAYLSHCGLYQSNATKASDCFRVSGGEPKMKIVTSLDGSLKFKTVNKRVREKHCRRYYQYQKAQNGTEKLSWFSDLSPTA